MSVSADYGIRVEWGDCDPAGIVFYPNYFRWLDAAAHHLFRTRLGDPAELLDRFGVIGWPLLELHTSFQQASRAGDDLIVHSQVDSAEGKTMKLQHTILNAGVVAVEGVETRAWCVRDPEKAAGLRAAQIPAEILARLSQ